MPTYMKPGFAPADEELLFRQKFPKPSCPAVDVQGRTNAAGGWIR